MSGFRRRSAAALMATVAIAIPLLGAGSGPAAFAASAPSPGTAASAATGRASEPLPPVEHVIPGLLHATAKEINTAEEIGCEEGRLDNRLCSLQADDLARMPADEKKSSTSSRRSSGNTRSRTRPLRKPARREQFPGSPRP
ncbi:hypothetical protein [Amycolatopsis sp. NPDC054798]